METQALNRLFSKLRKQVVKTINEFDLIGSGDRVMVAVSGGKDSAVLLYLLNEIRKKSPTDFYISAVMLDQKQPGFNADAFRKWVEKHNIDFHLIEEDTYSIVTDKTPAKKSFCGLCSRLRRGILYNYAFEHQYNKIALGHHGDDVIETVFLNMFYNGRLSTMPPKLKSDDGRNTVIRPMVHLRELEVANLAQQLDVPIIPCNLCGNQSDLKRQKMKRWLQEIDKGESRIGASILASLSNVCPSHLLDKNLYKF